MSSCLCHGAHFIAQVSLALWHLACVMQLNFLLKFIIWLHDTYLCHASCVHAFLFSLACFLFFSWQQLAPSSLKLDFQSWKRTNSSISSLIYIYQPPLKVFFRCKCHLSLSFFFFLSLSHLSPFWVFVISLFFTWHLTHVITHFINAPARVNRSGRGKKRKQEQNSWQGLVCCFQWAGNHCFQ